MPTSQQVLKHLNRTTDQIFGEADLISKIGSGRPLRIKFGVDCTAPDLHLGHAVNLWMMRYLQDLGHKVIFLLGDTTTRIGDPTGRESTRPVLSEEDIERNAEAFMEQVFLVLRNNSEVFEVRRNSEWYDQMAITDLIAELSLVTHSQLMARDMFQRRLQEHREIAVHELIYPVLQGFDSVALQSDLTIVGSDQLFNETMGRELQIKHGQVPQTVITSTITPGLDGGPKQSKSLNNYVGLAHSPEDKFGRLMRLNDELVGLWATTYTELPFAEADELGQRAARRGASARDAKLDLAQQIVARYHGRDVAAQARRQFLELFSEKKIPDSLPDLFFVRPQSNLLELVVLARPDLTRSAARRLIRGGGVRINETRQVDPDVAVPLEEGDVLRTGKRRWFRLRCAGASDDPAATTRVR